MSNEPTTLKVDESEAITEHYPLLIAFTYTLGYADRVVRFETDGELSLHVFVRRPDDAQAYAKLTLRCDEASGVLLPDGDWLGLVRVAEPEFRKDAEHFKFNLSGNGIRFISLATGE